MPDVDAKLAANIRAAKGKPMFFAFVANGTEGKLLVDKNKPPEGTVAAAKKKCGGGMIFRGRLSVADDGTLVFEMAKAGPATLPVLIKKVIKQDAGLTVKADVRMAGDPEEEEGEGQEATAASKTAPPPPPVPPQDGAAVTHRLNALADGIKTAITGPQATRVRTLLGAVNGFVKNKDFVHADKVLDELEPLVTQPQTSPKTDAKIPPPPRPLPPQPPDRKWSAALKALSPRISQALRAFPEQAGEIKQLQATAEKQLADKQFDKLPKSLDDLKKLLDSLSSVPGERVDAFREEWEKVLPAFEEAVVTVQSQMEALKSYLEGSDNEDLQQIAEYGLSGVTQNHLVPLRAALLELNSTGPEQLKLAAKRLQNVLAAFRKHIQTSEVVKASDQNPFGVAVSIQQTLTPGLAALDRGLQILMAS